MWIILGYVFRRQAFTWARLMNRLILSTLITGKFNSLRWLEHIEMFQEKHDAE